MSLVEILDSAAIDDLRTKWTAYKVNHDGKSILEDGAEKGFGQLYEPALSYILPSGAFFYGPGSQFDGMERERERCLVAVATAIDVSGSTFLPMHLFWGLMEGLEPSELADTVALAGLYSGLQHYLDGAKVLAAVLVAVKTALDPGYVPPQRPSNAIEVIETVVVELSKIQ